MRIVVLGAGVVGAATAYYLAQDGHAVTVVERASAPALGCSYANAGLVNGFTASPWSAPGIPATVLKDFWRADAPYRVRLRPDPTMAVWIARFFGNCTTTRTREIKTHLRRLSGYSLGLLQELRDAHDLKYDHRTDGFLYLYRTAKSFEAASAAALGVDDPRVRPKPLSAAALLEVEPSLANATVPFAGGLHYDRDESGDARLFTLGVARAATDAGVQFRFGTEATGVLVDHNRVRGVCLSRGGSTDDLAADAVVLAAGIDSLDLAAPFGIRLPMYPVKGYSITVQVTNRAALPRHTMQDAARKVTLTPLGDRLRIAGTAELAGRDTRINRRRADTLLAALPTLLPEVTWQGDPEYWSGLRPMTADSLPILGPTHVDGLWLNTGHGSFGFTLACGSGRVVADLIAGRPPAIDLTGLGVRT